MRQFFKEFKKHSFLLQYLITKDFKVKYRRSVLGIAWSVLNPLFMMIIVSAVFGLVFTGRLQELEGLSFPVYVILGQTMFNFLSESTTNAMQSIVTSASLIKKVYIPKYIFPLERVSFAFVNFAVSMVAVILVGIFEGIGISWHVLLTPVLFVFFYIFCLGLGLLLAAMTVFFRDTVHIYGIVLTAWNYLTPVFYSLGSIGLSGELTGLKGVFAKLLTVNPMYNYITVFRKLVLFHDTPTLMEVVYCVGFALLFMALGILVFRKKQDKFILYI